MDYICFLKVLLFTKFFLFLLTFFYKKVLLQNFLFIYVFVFCIIWLIDFYCIFCLYSGGFLGYKLLIIIFVPFLNEFDFFYFAIICVITGMCLGADMALPSSIQADVANETKQKEYRRDLAGAFPSCIRMVARTYLFSSTDWAAANLAIGTRNGEQLTYCRPAR